MADSDGVAFVGDGCVLPRRGGSDDRPMEISRGAVPFRSPESLRREFRLPHRGVVKGMLVPRGVTVIVGGGYHGQFRKNNQVLCLSLCVVVQVGPSKLETSAPVVGISNAMVRICIPRQEKYCVGLVIIENGL